MKYKISWNEIHSPDNWGEGKEDGSVDRDLGIKKILDSYPYVKHWFDEDGWLEGICEATIEAESVTEALEKAFDEFECDVFNILDEKGEVVATEDGALYEEDDDTEEDTDGTCVL